MELINFQLSGRFAHFLRAEASVSALSYPVPPRTVILGILGAILGLSKDKSQIVLEPANIAVSGKLPKTHWHRAKLRKDPPAPLSLSIKKTQTPRQNTVSEKATLILQEWLFEPDYTIWVSIPSPYLLQFENRLRERQWHYTPSLGLSEMMADIEYLGSTKCAPLPEGTYDIQSIFRQCDGTVDMEQVLKIGLIIHLLQMPRTVTPVRVFSHCRYVAERNAMPIPVKTNYAYKIDNKVIMFL
jgi:CRISPR-associated protein Cas5h